MDLNLFTALFYISYSVVLHIIKQLLRHKFVLIILIGFCLDSLNPFIAVICVIYFSYITAVSVATIPVIVYGYRLG